MATKTKTKQAEESNTVVNNNVQIQADKAEIESLKKTVSYLKGQVTQLNKRINEVPSIEEHNKIVRSLELHGIVKKGHLKYYETVNKDA